MAKSQNNGGKPNTPASSAQQAAPESPNLQEGADSNVADQNNAGDQDGRLLITLPADINEGITEIVAQLQAAYTDVDVDQVLAARFKPEVDPAAAEAAARNDILLVTGFELAFPLDALADNITEGLTAVQNALDSRTAPEGTTFPEALIDFQFPLTVLERYIQGVLHTGKRLEDVELVFADPEVDSHLKSLNFSRLLQGLPETHMYLRFL